MKRPIIAIIVAIVLIALTIWYFNARNEAEDSPLGPAAELPEDLREGYALQDSISNSVIAFRETELFYHEAGEDAIDDPAIWVNYDSVEASLVYTTNKRSGLEIYDLQGKKIKELTGTRYNNIDIRQGCILGTDTLDIAAASNISENGIDLFRNM